MTLDQISLLNKRANLSVLQELVGMIPEKKLTDFLEVVFSPDKSNTMKAIRDFMKSGAFALALTLDQIILLNKRNTLSVVQELVGMVLEKKLIDFLQVVFSLDTSNTVKAIRDFMESGAFALALISQLATLIIDVLAGNNRSKDYRLKHVRK
ncbi:hypothetical protein GOP47_0018177 [Adiantum capillus-veneris]|uniref:Uncharacterized protein n=1 Tax=Adiantum capillus-veneris TaxID=13818 RepID=A0A9D4UHQ2_ADICA|nr:hypothetical protein GOP47_0018177 [Adiantum capillus-veneris]